MRQTLTSLINAGLCHFLKLWRHTVEHLKQLNFSIIFGTRHYISIFFICWFHLDFMTLVLLLNSPWPWKYYFLSQSSDCLSVEIKQHATLNSLKSLLVIQCMLWRLDQILYMCLQQAGLCISFKLSLLFLGWIYSANLNTNSISYENALEESTCATIHWHLMPPLCPLNNQKRIGECVWRSTDDCTQMQSEHWVHDPVCLLWRYCAFKKCILAKLLC